MAQADQLKSIRLLFFNDDELKELMAIPEKDYYSIIAFRDFYCNVSAGTYENIEIDQPCRLIISWGDMSNTNNHMVNYRPLGIEIWVQRTYEYGTTNNVFDRRQELIANRIKKLICSAPIEHFKFQFEDMYDMRSNTQDYNRFFMRFRVKFIK